MQIEITECIRNCYSGKQVNEGHFSDFSAIWAKKAQLLSKQMHDEQVLSFIAIKSNCKSNWVLLRGFNFHVLCLQSVQCVRRYLSRLFCRICTPTNASSSAHIAAAFSALKQLWFVYIFIVFYHHMPNILSWVLCTLPSNTSFMHCSALKIQGSIRPKPTEVWLRWGTLKIAAVQIARLFFIHMLERTILVLFFEVCKKMDRITRLCLLHCSFTPPSSLPRSFFEINEAENSTISLVGNKWLRTRTLWPLSCFLCRRYRIAAHFAAFYSWHDLLLISDFKFDMKDGSAFGSPTHS